MGCPACQSRETRRADLLGAWITIGSWIGWMFVVAGIACLMHVAPRGTTVTAVGDIATVGLGLAGLLSILVGISPAWLERRSATVGAHICLDCQFTWQTYTD